MLFGQFCMCQLACCFADTNHMLLPHHFAIRAWSITADTLPVFNSGLALAGSNHLHSVSEHSIDVASRPTFADVVFERDDLVLKMTFRYFCGEDRNGLFAGFTAKDIFTNYVGSTSGKIFPRIQTVKIEGTDELQKLQEHAGHSLEALGSAALINTVALQDRRWLGDVASWIEELAWQLTGERLRGCVRSPSLDMKGLIGVKGLLPWGCDFEDSAKAKVLGELGYALLYQPRDINDTVLENGPKTGATDAAIMLWNQGKQEWRCYMQIECKNVADGGKVKPHDIAGHKHAFNANDSGIAVIVCRYSAKAGTNKPAILYHNCKEGLIAVIQLGKDCDYL